MTHPQHPLRLSPQQHAALMAAAKRQAAQLHREAINDAISGLLTALRRGLASAVKPLRQGADRIHHGLRPCAD